MAQTPRYYHYMDLTRPLIWAYHANKLEPKADPF